MKKKTVIFAGLILFLIVSCEPNDWNLILDGIDDVTNLSVTHPQDEDAVFSYTLPECPISELREDYGYHLYFYYSPANTDTRTYVREEYYQNPTEGDTDIVTIDMTSYNLTGVSQYTFTVYT